MRRHSFSGQQRDEESSDEYVNFIKLGDSYIRVICQMKKDVYSYFISKKGVHVFD